MDVLAQCITYSSIDDIYRALQAVSINDNIRTPELRGILERTGGASDFDASKVCSHLGGPAGVKISQIMKYMDLAVEEARAKSKSVQKFNKMI